MQASALLAALSKKLNTNSQTELAKVLGVSVQTLINWKNRGEDLSPTQIASAITKSCEVARNRAHFDAIKPIVEYYEIDAIEKGTGWQIFDGGDNDTLHARGLRSALAEASGVYIFYDSRGKSIYAGKANPNVQSVRQAHFPVLYGAYRQKAGL